jgi:peptide/nickel transport system permease protein
MIKYIIRRLLQSIPILFGITLLSYLLMTAAPGGPVAALAFNPSISASERQRLEARLGVNDPWLVQYLRWLIGDDWMRRDTDGDGTADTAILIPLDADGDGVPEPPGERRGVLRGDFGISFTHRRPVLDVLFERVPATLELSIAALLIGASVGITIGVLAAVRRGGVFDNFSRVMAVVFDAIPGFWLGLMLILLLGSQLGLLPMQGRCRVTMDDSCPPVYQRIEYLVLPTFILATGLIAGYSRFTRASMLDVIGEDYMRTARAKGLSDRVVWFKHGARNALIPIATFLGPALTGLLGGAVITETVFSWPGVGREAIAAVSQRNYPVVMAVTVYAALATIIGYLISDILYGIIDPRIRLE